MAPSLEALILHGQPEAYNGLLSEEEPRIYTPRRSFYDALAEDIPRYIALWDGIINFTEPYVPKESVDWKHPSGRGTSVATIYRDLIPRQVNNDPKDFNSDIVPSEELGAPFYLSCMRQLFHAPYHPMEKHSGTADQRKYHLTMAYAAHELNQLPNPQRPELSDDPSDEETAAYLRWQENFMESSQLGTERASMIRDSLRLPPKESSTPSWVSNAAFDKKISHRRRDPLLLALFDPQLLDMYFSESTSRYSNGRRMDCVNDIPEII